MRTVFSCVLYALLALTCWTETTPATDKNVLESTIKHLGQFNSTVQQTDTIFFTPPVDIKDCCSESALDCFRSQINNITSNNKRLQNKLHKNLRKSENIVKSKCEAARKAECMSCNLYEKTDSHKFLNNLLLLLQKSFITK
ncbi:interleukin-21 [Astyanax mexicanus]|uniref:Interleukin n=1 Tax=Astyanax mexicanus TaxID=7994 RepID=A0A8T2M9M2_ASTMX|nr:interleukin-21 [Astyanax mexicanus]